MGPGGLARRQLATPGKEKQEMARKCEICGKGPLSGNTVSHAHNKNLMRQLPNIQKVHVVVDGHKKTMRVCTRCIKSGRVQKSA